jgi:hypothetical protein
VEGGGLPPEEFAREEELGDVGRGRHKQFNTNRVGAWCSIRVPAYILPIGPGQLAHLRISKPSKRWPKQETLVI